MARTRFGFLRTLNVIAYAPLAGRAPMYARLLLALVRDGRIPTAHKALVALALGYVASPIDLVPEWIPIVGVLDDVAVLVLALDAFIDSVPEELLQEKLADLGIDPAELARDRARIRRIVPAPIRAVAHRIPAVLDRVDAVIQRSGAETRLREFISNRRESA
jgi:uncharacterized membrane protein YkvA (DUF1232 family)